ncbi:MAG: GerW family sporulation protein [Bacillota bacterium]
MGYELPAGMWDVLDKHLSTKTVTGEPVTFGEVTLIPIMDLMFGYGGGSGDARNEKAGSSIGGGGGGGARLAPKAVIVIKGSEVQVLPLNKGGAMEKIVEALPGLLEKVQVTKAAKAEPKAEE